MKTKCDLMRCFASPLHPILYAMQTHVVVCTVILTNFFLPFCCFILTWHTDSNYCWCHFCDTGYVLSVFRSLSKRWALSCSFLPFLIIFSFFFYFCLLCRMQAVSYLTWCKECLHVWKTIKFCSKIIITFFFLGELGNTSNYIFGYM